MNYKLVVCDMDGTLLSSKHTISEYTKEIINKLKDKNIKIIIATGRPYLDAKFFRDQLNLNSYLVTANGANAHDEKENKIVDEYIPKEFVKEILSLNLNTEKYHRNVYLNNNWYVEFEIEGLVEFHKESNYKFQIYNFEKLKNKDVTKIFFLGDKDNIALLENKLKNKFKDNLNIAISSDFCLEIMKKNISKKSALDKILKDLSIEWKDVIAFGDGMNDFEMLKAAGKACVMINGREKLKEKLPNAEIIEDCNEDGVAKKLKEIFKL